MIIILIIRSAAVSDHNAKGVINLVGIIRHCILKNIADHDVSLGIHPRNTLCQRKSGRIMAHTKFSSQKKKLHIRTSFHSSLSWF